MSKKKLDISVVIPVYNEEKSIEALYQESLPVLKSLKKAYEIIFIDDGSDDQTSVKIRKIKKRDKNIKLIQLQGNFGKASALQAGFDQAKGKYLITLDGDLQDDPKEIPKFLKKIRNDYDLVCGWKYKRQDSPEKIIFSKVANFFTRKATGVKVHDMNCGFKAYKKAVIENLSLYGEMHRYVPALVAQKGFKVGEIKIAHRPRKYGKSKYGLRRLLRGFFDFITVVFLTTFATRPLHFFGSIGLFFGIIGFTFGTYLTILWFQGQGIGQRPLLLLAVLMVVLGVQFFSIGLIGEMLANKEIKRNYIIKQILE